MKYYWIKKSGTFGRNVSFGGEMPSLPKERIDQLFKAGYISEKQPVNFDEASANELAEMKKQVAVLSEENAALKSDIARLKKEVAGSNDAGIQIAELKKQAEQSQKWKSLVEELEAELEDVPKNVREANQKIKKLEKEIDALTKPGGK